MLESILVGGWWLCVNVYHEARGEDLTGKVAVAHATINRAITRSLSIEKVVFQAYQFSWTNGIDHPKSLPIKNPHAMVDCIYAVSIANAERTRGLHLSGADHYFNPDRFDSKEDWPDWAKPEWSHRYIFVGKFGSHRFYRDNQRGLDG